MICEKATCSVPELRLKVKHSLLCSHTAHWMCVPELRVCFITFVSQVKVFYCLKPRRSSGTVRGNTQTMNPLNTLSCSHIHLATTCPVRMLTHSDSHNPHNKHIHTLTTSWKHSRGQLSRLGNWSNRWSSSLQLSQIVSGGFLLNKVSCTTQF